MKVMIDLNVLLDVLHTHSAAVLSDYVVTRNTSDFEQSPVPAILPAQLLILMQQKPDDA